MFIKQLLQTTSHFGKYQQLKIAYAGYTHAAFSNRSARWISQNKTLLQNIENQQHDEFVLLHQQSHAATDDNSLYCYICKQLFTTSMFPLSVRAKRMLKNGACVCLGCRRQLPFYRNKTWKLMP